MQAPSPSRMILVVVWSPCLVEASIFPDAFSLQTRLNPSPVHRTVRAGQLHPAAFCVIQSALLAEMENNVLKKVFIHSFIFVS